MVGQTHIMIPRPGFLVLLRHLSGGAPFELMWETRAFFCVVGILVGITVSSSSTLAKVEEAVSQDGLKSDHSDSELPDDLIVNFSTNNSDNDENYSIINRFNDGIEFTQYNTDNKRSTTSRYDKSGLSKNLDSFGKVFIPEAVWSSEVSTGVDLDRISGQFGTEFDTVFSGGQKNAGLWTKAVPSLWPDNNGDRPSDVLQLSPLQIQVASCGGDAAEHSNLEFCHIGGNSAIQADDNSTQPERSNSNGTVAAQVGSSSIGSLSVVSTSNQESQSDISPITPAIANKLVQQDNLIVLSALLGQCDDVSASCATIQIDPSTAPIDSPTAPIDSPIAPTDSPIAPTDPPTAPIDYPAVPIDSPAPPDPPPAYPVISVGDPGPILDPLPISAPPLVASPVPETSTWVMTMIGFGIMVLVGRRRAFHPIKQAVVTMLFQNHQEVLSPLHRMITYV